nr:VP3 [Lye Green virus]
MNLLPGASIHQRDKISRFRKNVLHLEKVVNKVFTSYTITFVKPTSNMSSRLIPRIPVTKSPLKTAIQVELRLWGAQGLDNTLLKKICVCVIWESYKGVVDDPELWSHASQALYQRMKRKCEWAPIMSQSSAQFLVSTTWFSLHPRNLYEGFSQKRTFSRLFHFHSPTGGILSVDYVITLRHNTWDLKEYGNMVLMGYLCLEQTNYVPNPKGVISLAIEDLKPLINFDPYQMVRLLGLSPMIEDPIPAPSKTRSILPAKFFKK